MFLKTLFVAAVLSIANFAAAAEVGCDIGLYSKYVAGAGSVADTAHKPAIQGSCRYSFKNGVYVEGWASQSTHSPGLKDTYNNEVDVTLGIDKKINEKWSYDVHIAYFDIANPRLLQGLNGDLGNGGATLRYQVTSDTMVYANLEGYHGFGERGLPGGWRAGFGVRTLLGPVVVDGTLFHNQNFLGHGQFLKVMLEPKAPMAKFAGGEVRPTIFLWQPLGEYGRTHDRQLVGGVHVTF